MGTQISEDGQASVDQTLEMLRVTVETHRKSVEGLGAAVATAVTAATNAQACIGEIRDELRGLRSDLTNDIKEIRGVVLGRPDLGQAGLVEKQNALVQEFRLFRNQPVFKLLTSITALGGFGLLAYFIKLAVERG